MEYKRFDNMIVARFDVGEEIVDCVEKIANKENIKLAMVNALGATDHFITGAYSVEKKEYFQTERTGFFEIVSLHGSINTMDGKFYTHLHMSCGDKDGNVFGGHLNKAYISATCEMFITIIDGVVDREKNEEIGINTFKF